MTDYKREKKTYNRPCVVEKEQVLSDILQCDIFGWSWCEVKTGVHHTAIIFYLDYEARYSVNWSPRNGSKKTSIFCEIEGQLVYEDERLKDQARIDYKPCLEEYDVVGMLHAENDEIVNYFLNLIERLSRFTFSKYDNIDAVGNAKKYDISSCNCRDHVESVLRDVLLPGEELRQALAHIKGVRWERLPEVLIYGAAKFRGFLSLVLSIVYPGLSIDIEKAIAKYVGPDIQLLDALDSVRESLSAFISTCTQA